MTTWQRIVVDSLTAIAAGGLLFAVALATGGEPPLLIAAPVGLASLYLTTRMTCLSGDPAGRWSLRRNGRPMTLWQRIVVLALTATAMGGLFFAIGLVSGSEGRSLVVSAVGGGSLYFIAQVTRLTSKRSRERETRRADDLIRQHERVG